MRLHDFLDYRAREQGEAVFAIHGDRYITYRAAQVEANRLANALVDSGLQPGDRLAILSKNSIEYMLLISHPPRQDWSPSRSITGSHLPSGAIF